MNKKALVWSVLVSGLVAVGILVATTTTRRQRADDGVGGVLYLRSHEKHHHRKHLQKLKPSPTNRVMGAALIPHGDLTFDPTQVSGQARVEAEALHAGAVAAGSFGCRSGWHVLASFRYAIL